MRFSAKIIGSTIAILLVGILVSSVFGSTLLDAVESWRGPLSYEFALRWELLVAAVVWFIVSILFWRLSWWAILTGLLTLGTFAVITVFDVNNELQKEFSWIRYPTAGWLFLAALFALVYSIRSRGWFWMLFTAGFAYAGADELLQIHERLGAKLEAWFHLPHVTTDLITVFYGLAGAVVTVIALRYLWTSKRFAAGLLLLSGVVVFAFSQMLDTLDVLIDPAFRKLALLLSARGHIFSNSWYFFYEPKRFSNSLEELLECIAGLLFALAMFALLTRVERFPLRAFWNALALKARVAGALAFFVVLFGIVAVPASSPVLGSATPVRLGGPKNGLIHSDDLFFDPAFGVLLANEGGHNVLQLSRQSLASTDFPLKNKAKFSMSKLSFDMPLQPVSDSKRVLRDMDSVTAANGKIYVSDGDAGKIFSSTGDGVWEVVADRSNGLKHPEGIVVVDNAIIGVDESERALFKLQLPSGLLSLRGVPSDGTTKQSRVYRDGIATARTGGPRNDKKVDFQPMVEWYRPNTPKFMAPEGIAYDKAHQRFLVTDDKTGTLWSVDFGKSAERVTTSGVQLKNPEDIEVLANGDILLTDNGRGEVLLLSGSSSGNSVTLNRLLRFRRMYRDLQGVTMDDAGNLYVVTADAYASASFMPSFLWTVPHW